MRCPECRSIIPNHKLDCGTGRSQASVPRAVGGWSPEEWADRIRQDIDHCQDDLPDYKISMHEGDLILRRKGEGWQNDYIVLW